MRQTQIIDHMIKVFKLGECNYKISIAMVGIVHYIKFFSTIYILGWPKNFEFFGKMLWRNLNEVLGQSNILQMLQVIC